tara:strand:+ start:7240 stop:7398 length:159 start_codon:yes stop_codon:yes gene_type:complete
MNKRERDLMRDKMFEDLLELVSLLVENQKTILKKLEKIENPKTTKKTKRRLQ